MGRKIFWIISIWLFIGFLLVRPAAAWDWCSGTVTKSYIRACDEISPGICAPVDIDTYTEPCQMFTGGCTDPTACTGDDEMTGCYALMQSAICGFVPGVGCDVIEQGYFWEKCSAGTSAACAASAPACDGSGCLSGQYCAAKVSSPNECTCKTATGDGCYGGWVFVGPDNSIRRCCTVVAPGAPTLVYPADGAQLTDGEVSLSWMPPTDWGGDCPATNRTEGVMLGSSPTTMSYVYRQAAPYVTSVSVVGTNVEIVTQNTAVGSNVNVLLKYQSSAITFNGSTLIRGGLYPDALDNGFCVDMSTKPGWNYETSIAWITYLQNYSTCTIYGGGLNYETYYSPTQYCTSWDGGGTCPLSTSYVRKDCDICGGKEGDCKSCFVDTYDIYNYDGYYTREISYTGTHTVQAGGIVRIPTSSLSNWGSPSFGMSAAVSSTAGSGLPLFLAPGTYYWQAEADNGTDVPGNPSSSPVWSFTISAEQTVTGNVYYDPGNTCSTTTPTGLDGNLNIHYSSNEPASYDVAVPNSGASIGSFGVTTAGTTLGTLTLENMPSGYTCSTGCSQSCPAKTNVVSSSTGNNFFVTDQRGAWWQANGAGVYAGSSSGGTVISSQIPSSVSASERYLVTSMVGGTAAAVVRASGSVSTLSGEVNDSDWSAVSSYKGKRMDYKFFANQLGVTFSQTNDWAADTMNKPSYSASKDFYYLNPSSGTATISSPWSVVAGEKYVVLIDGDLRISQNVAVADGGFLAIVVSGDITIDSSVTQVEGLYVSSGSFLTQSAGSANDAQLGVGGSVVAWGGVSLGRDMGVDNISDPAELFGYRSDLLRNMPDSMKTFVMSWEEVPAGTFGD